ncbi:helix-turn-helix domain-containing protein [Xanthomarina gelatinilytica]|uniref:helix-turn-helix domain-containing protein n=1 Tax=Xanthomarina gelatinilytica TaxID=1137281 RepID=UPI003AA9CCA2
MKGIDLKNKRLEMGLTQADLAKMVGKSPRTIITWENSEEISPSTVKLIQAVLQIDEILNKEFSEIGNEEKRIQYAKEINKIADSKVNEALEIFNTKAGSTYEELPSGKYLLTVPMVPVRAQATYISEYTDAEYISELKKISFIVDRVGKGKYQAFEVQNDSMNDGTINSIPDGAIVLGRELGKQHWKSKLNTNGYPYWVIVHKNTILCKEIISHDVEKGTITCHSLNDSPEFQDFTIKLDDCHQLFNIIKKQI